MLRIELLEVEIFNLKMGLFDIWVLLFVVVKIFDKFVSVVR